MEIVILVFFFAIFGGVLFLLALVWFIFRRIRKSRPNGRNFSNNSTNYGSSGYDALHHQNMMDSDDDAAAIYAGSSLFSDQEPEKTEAATQTAHDNPQKTDDSYSHESHGASAAPAETSYTESSYSSYDSGSSYDSSSSYDSGSSSSDSGASSSDSSSSSSSSD